MYIRGIGILREQKDFCIHVYIKFQVDIFWYFFYNLCIICKAGQ